jgi:hypothetical protein
MSFSHERPLTHWYDRSKNSKASSRASASTSTSSSRKRAKDKSAEAENPPLKRSKALVNSNEKKTRPRHVVASGTIIDLTEETQAPLLKTEAEFTPKPLYKARPFHNKNDTEMMTPPPSSLPQEKVMASRTSNILSGKLLSSVPPLPPTPASIIRPLHISTTLSAAKRGHTPLPKDMDFEIPETPEQSPVRPRLVARSDSVVPTSQSNEEDFFVRLIRKRTRSTKSLDLKQGDTIMFSEDEVIGTSQSQEMPLDTTFVDAHKWQRNSVPIPREMVPSSQSQSELDLTWTNERWDPGEVTVRADE